MANEKNPQLEVFLWKTDLQKRKKKGIQRNKWKKIHFCDILLSKRKRKKSIEMGTTYIDAKGKETEIVLEPAVQALKEGKLVILPTETVYGIGADGRNQEAVLKIFEAKGRKQDNPLILHVCNRSMIDQIAEITSPIEEQLIHTFMPGPFTIILKKKNCIPEAVTAGNPTVAVRMPSNCIANRLIAEFGGPIAAPSANLSGKPSGTLMEDIDQALKEKVAVAIDDGPSKIGLESTVVKVIDGEPTILRPGQITLADIQAVCGKGKVDVHILHKMQSQEEKVESPGMKYRHYAPKTKCKMVYSPNPEKMVKTIKNKMQEAKKEGKKVILLTLSEDSKAYANEDVEAVLEMGSRQKLEEVSSRIFTLLRKVDDYHADLVLIEGVTKDGLGLAIMNRLLRSCEYDYTEI